MIIEEEKIMGQKANPNGMRLGINKDWKSRYYPANSRDWATWSVADRKVRKYLAPFYKEWALSSVEVERSEKEYKLIINTSRPGTVIGEEGKNTKAIEIAVARILKDKSINI